MIKIIFQILIFSAVLAAGTAIDWNQLHEGRRSSGLIHAWIYLSDKSGAETGSQIALSPRALARRQARGSMPDTGMRDIPVNSNYVDRISETGVAIRTRSRWLNAVSVSASEVQLAEISKLSFVTDIQPVGLSTRNPIGENTAAQKATTSGISGLDYGASLEQIEQINVNAVHESGFLGQDVIILVLDTGFELSHPVFDSIDVIAEWDFINDDNITANQPGDHPSQQNHGTAVLSVMGGYAPGSYIGSAPRASYILAKTEIYDREIQAEEDLYVKAVEWGDSLGADVISSSLGYNDWYTFSDLDGNTAVTTKILNWAAEAGIVCVTAAGNFDSHMPEWNYIIAPADAKSVISVGAVDYSGEIAGFSLGGPTADGRIKPEVCARGLATRAASSVGSGYYSTNGTSFSTPLVAGAAASILSAKPDLNPGQVREALMMTADRAYFPDNLYGYGIIDAGAALNYDFIPVNISGGCYLAPIYPNPYLPRISYPFANLDIILVDDGRTTLDILDLNGAVVSTLASGWLAAGKRQFQWDGSDYASGIYFARLRTGGDSVTRKMILIK